MYLIIGLLYFRLKFILIVALYNVLSLTAINSDGFDIRTNNVRSNPRLLNGLNGGITKPHHSSGLQKNFKIINKFTNGVNPLYFESKQHLSMRNKALKKVSKRSLSDNVKEKFDKLLFINKQIYKEIPSAIVLKDKTFTSSWSFILNLVKLVDGLKETLNYAIMSAIEKLDLNETVSNSASSGESVTSYDSNSNSASESASSSDNNTASVNERASSNDSNGTSINESASSSDGKNDSDNNINNNSASINESIEYLKNETFSDFNDSSNVVQDDDIVVKESKVKDDKINAPEAKQLFGEETKKTLFNDTINCPQGKLENNETIISILQEKLKRQNREREKKFADRFHSHLLEVEKFVRTDDDRRYINLSSLVYAGFLNRLRYSNEEIVNDFMQTLPQLSNETEGTEKDDCLLRQSIKRLKLVHRIASLLILSLPWSIEDILSTQDNELIIDYIFRPMNKKLKLRRNHSLTLLAYGTHVSGKYLFDVPCLDCYRRIYGKCMEIYFCKQGSSIGMNLPPSYLLP